MRLTAFTWASVLCAQTAFYPLDQVRPGQRATGKTIFAGARIEEFEAEVLGVMRNVGPKQSLILARLSGGPLAHSGVLQGMSGSPVYLEGKLLGAVAVAFPFSKDPVAGIRPIDDMLRVSPPPASTSPRARLLGLNPDLAASLPAATRWETAAGAMTDIATPLHLGGFTAATLGQFTPALRALGLEPMQGAGGGGAAGARGRIEPGSMISVQLVNGDLHVGADGTVTHVDGNRIYAFGHRFLAVGATEIPFARSEVLTVLPSLATSFKITSAREWHGTITGDYTAAVAGELGRRAALVPVRVNVQGARPGARQSYRLEMVRERLLTPFFLQMAVFSLIDATERSSGASTVSVRGRIDFQPGTPHAAIDNIYAMETATPIGASLAASIPLGFAMQSGHREFEPRSIELDIQVADGKRQFQIDDLTLSRTVARPGDTVTIHAVFTGPGRETLERTAQWRIPAGAVNGALQFTLSEAMITNVAEYSHIGSQPPLGVAQVAAVLNGLRPNNVATLRITRGEPGYVIQGQQLSDPPPSLALLLKRNPGSALPALASKVADIDFRIQGAAIAGTRAVQLEVKR